MTTLKGKDFVNIEEVSRDQMLAIFKKARSFEKKRFPLGALKGKMIASLFFETSTRTRLSFETAAKRLGAGVIGFSGIEGTSMEKKGESLEDTIQVIDGYADLIVIRHPEGGSVERAAVLAEHPVVNAGDGTRQHPTQTLLDLYAMLITQGKIDGLTVALVGDLQYSRVSHSTAKALTQFRNVRQIWVAPEQLRMPDDVRAYVKERGGNVSETADLTSVIPEVDILLMTRIQQERFEDQGLYEQFKDVYVLRPELLKSAQKQMRILHPLPRRYEIPVEIDRSPHAYYFQQARSGVPLRAALLALILGKR